jgi:hypothetical protein
MALADDMQENVLGQIFGFRGVAQNFSANPMNKTVMAPKENAEGFSIRRSDAGQEVFIGAIRFLVKFFPFGTRTLRSPFGKRKCRQPRCRKRIHS